MTSAYSLLDVILKTLKADGNVLLPVDPAGRVLELLLLLEQVSSILLSTLYRVI